MNIKHKNSNKSKKSTSERNDENEKMRRINSSSDEENSGTGNSEIVTFIGNTRSEILNRMTSDPYGIGKIAIIIIYVIIYVIIRIFALPFLTSISAIDSPTIKDNIRI